MCSAAAQKAKVLAYDVYDMVARDMRLLLLFMLWSQLKQCELKYSPPSMRQQETRYLPVVY